MDESTREAVRQRAGARCEYCRLRENRSVLPFELEHIIALKHGGGDNLENLAFACRYCNSYKGANIAGIDPQTGKVASLFHPRRQRWREHFRWDGPVLTGLSESARATIQVLRINLPEFVELRESLLAEGESFE